ncbi:MAG TPA: Gfo/Idh/MocA family oxidoreductase [Anaerolineales bacterium]|nr:Gfo/Idh/MocA family oxidoreductase [Anaerolineales bacterium]
MSSKTLRWGLLSTARINQKLIPQFTLSKRNKLVAVASRSQEKANSYAHENRIPRAYGSYEALLADPEIDVIYNPLPNHLHAEWSIKAVEAGKHVLCEKPLALTLAEVDAMATAAGKCGRLIAEAFAYRAHPHMRKIKELIDGGKLGRIKLVHGTFSFVMPVKEDIRWDPSMGGGSLWDIGCYPLSFARMVLGTEPLEVFGWQETSPSGVDATLAGQLRFPGDIYFQLDCSFRVPSHEYMEIVGDEGTLSIPQPFNVEPQKSLYLSWNGKTSRISAKGPDPYLAEMENFADAILLNKMPVTSLADSRLNTAAILALLESAKTGKPVLL